MIILSAFSGSTKAEISLYSKLLANATVDDQCKILTTGRIRMPMSWDILLMPKPKSTCPT